MLLAPLVLVHLGLILFAVRGGLTAGEILSRTHQSAGWAIFYSVFVVACAIHAPIGVRNVLIEWTSLPRGLINVLMVFFSVSLAVLGIRAVVALVG